VHTVPVVEILQQFNSSGKCNCANRSQVLHRGSISDNSSHSMLPAQHLRPTDFLCGWSVGLEFPARQLAVSGYWQEQFQTIFEDIPIRDVLMHSGG